MHVLQATESINKIAGLLSPRQVEDYLVPMVRKLSTGDWFTSRTSSAALYVSVYPSSASHKDELRKLYSALAHDDTPMVRRAAAKGLGVGRV